MNPICESALKCVNPRKPKVRHETMLDELSIRSCQLFHSCRPQKDTMHWTSTFKCVATCVECKVIPLRHVQTNTAFDVDNWRMAKIRDARCALSRTVVWRFVLVHASLANEFIASSLDIGLGRMH